MFNIGLMSTTAINAIFLLVLVIAPFWNNKKLSGKTFWVIITTFLVSYVLLEAIISHFFYPLMFQLPYSQLGFEVFSDEYWDFVFSDEYGDIMRKNILNYIAKILIQVYYIVKSLIVFVFCYLIIKTQTSKFINICLFVKSCLIFLGITQIIITGIHFKYFGYDYTTGLPVIDIVNILVAILLASVCVLFLVKYVKPNVINSAIPTYRYLWIISLIFMLVLDILYYTSIYDLINEFVFFFISLLFITGLFLVTYFVIRMIIQTENNTQLNFNLALAKHQIELQGDHYKQLQAHIDETRKAHHDLKHHLTVIQSFIETGEKEKLTDYVSQYKSSLPDDTIVFCGNFAINSLLWYYLGIAKNEGVHVDVNIELPVATGISDTDLCIIFGNSIENAIEACRKLSGERYIRIYSKLTGKLLTITIDNSFNGEVKKDDEKFISTKHEGHGIGTISMKAVAQKYDGAVEFSTRDDEFQVSIMLRIP